MALVEEYDGTVAEQDKAATAAAAIGSTDIALLSGHGLFVVGSDLVRVGILVLFPAITLFLVPY